MGQIPSPPLKMARDLNATLLFEAGFKSDAQASDAGSSAAFYNLLLPATIRLLRGPGLLPNLGARLFYLFTRSYFWSYAST